MRLAGQCDLTIHLFEALLTVSDLGDSEEDAPLCQTQPEASEEGYTVYILR